MPAPVDDLPPVENAGADQKIVPQRIGFYIAAILFAGWLVFLGYLASLTWRG